MDFILTHTSEPWVPGTEGISSRIYCGSEFVAETRGDGDLVTKMICDAPKFASQKAFMLTALKTMKTHMDIGVTKDEQKKLSTGLDSIIKFVEGD